MKKDVRIAVMGAKGVGKSALIRRCLTDMFEEETTPGKDVAYRFTTSKNITIDIVDFNGKNDALISCADGFVICYSIVERESFLAIETFLHKILEANIKKPKIAIIGNKNDLYEKREVSSAEGLSIAKEINSLFYESSANIPVTNIRQIFLDLHKCISSTKKSKRRLQVFSDCENTPRLDKSVINTNSANKSLYTQEHHFGTIKKKMLVMNYKSMSLDS